MNNQKRGLNLGLGVAVLVVVAALPVAWYLVSPLFITRTVDEPLPGAAATMPMDDDMMGTATPEMLDDAMMGTATPEMMDEAMPAMETAEMSTAEADEMMAMEATHGMETAMAMPTEMMAEPMPTEAPAEPVVLAQGSFYHLAHEGAGTATLFELPDGSRVLRLEDFTVLNGPDLHVYLAPVDPVPNTVGVELDGAVDLGQLKGNVGSQNYELSADLDLSQFKSVVIWCQPFRVPFIAAALQ